MNPQALVHGSNFGAIRNAGRHSLLLATAVFAVVLLPSSAAAFAASPANVNFGDVPINTTATQSIAITVDAGYEITMASGGLNAPWSFDWGTCWGSFAGPGTCTVNEGFSPVAAGAASATLTLYQCPSAGGACLPISIPLSGTGVSTLSVSTSSLVDGSLGSAYGPIPLQASGGTGARTWSLTEGNLPPGLTLDPATGNISGTPTVAGLFTFTVSVTDSGTPSAQTATKQLSIRVMGTADVSVSLSSSAAVKHNKPLTYQIVVQNLGPDATIASLTDTLPIGAQFKSFTTSQGSCTTPPVGSAGTINCNLGTMAPGSTATITITVDPEVKKGTISTTVAVSADSFTTDPVSSNNTAIAVVQVK